MFPLPPPPKKNWAVDVLTTGLIVQQAQIASLLPGARLTGLSAPYAMLIGRHKHLVRPLS